MTNLKLIATINGSNIGFCKPQISSNFTLNQCQFSNLGCVIAVLVDWFHLSTKPPGWGEEKICLPGLSGFLLTNVETLP